MRTLKRNVTQDEINACFKEMDVDENGHISEEEFVMVICSSVS